MNQVSFNTKTEQQPRTQDQRRQELQNGMKFTYKHSVIDSKLRQEYRRSVGTILDAEARAIGLRETMESLACLRRQLVSLEEVSCQEGQILVVEGFKKPS